MHQPGRAVRPLPFDSEIWAPMLAAVVVSIGMIVGLGAPFASIWRAWMSLPWTQMTVHRVPFPGSPPTSTAFCSALAGGLISVKDPSANGAAAFQVRPHTV